MLKRLSFVWVLSLVLVVMGAPVAAATPEFQEGGRIHFGPYTLSSGDVAAGDLVVFGPVTLGAESRFDGDLVAFGTVSVGEGAVIEGQLVAMGDVDIKGVINGDVFAAGALNLRKTARVTGDVSVVGQMDQADGAVVEGSITPVESIEGVDWNVPVPFFDPGNIRVGRTPGWLKVFGAVARGIVGVVVMGLLALIIVSLWPQQMQRVGRVVEEVPLTAFGVGLLLLIVAGILFFVLSITICLSPIALLGAFVVGAGILFGWVALGAVLGERILVGLFNQSKPTLALSTVFGTFLISVIIAMAQVFWPIWGLLFFLLLPPLAGAVLLTRFGTLPYATRGTGIVRPTAPLPSQLPEAPVPAPPVSPPTSVEEGIEPKA